MIYFDKGACFIGLVTIPLRTFCKFQLFRCVGDSVIVRETVVNNLLNLLLKVGIVNVEGDMYELFQSILKLFLEPPIFSCR